MLLTSYGRRECLLISVFALIAIVLAGTADLYWLVGIIIVIWVALLAFFRDPSRRVPTDLAPGDMLSPADGTISAVERVDHHESTDGPAVIVRIFLSVLDVHINRSPCDGVVDRLIHRPGKYRDARIEESAKVNESNLIILLIESGETIGVRQVSGAVARRIVCPLKSGAKLARGQRFGMIKFGSTTELILPRPDDVDVKVAPGDKVKGGLNVLASLSLDASATE